MNLYLILITIVQNNTAVRNSMLFLNFILLCNGFITMVLISN